MGSNCMLCLQLIAMTSWTLELEFNDNNTQSTSRGIHIHTLVV